jgi:hypothetical protein
MRNEARFARPASPWTIAGGPDPDYDEAHRTVHHALLTSESLLIGFRRRFPHHRDEDYDVVVRLLDYVWDCPHDGAANVAGYRCARCGRTRATAQDLGGLRLPSA